MNPADELPALLGGPPVRPQGPPDWPIPDEDVANALNEAYGTGNWGKYHGGTVELLEQRLAAHHDLPFALTCGSGTFAVEIALRALKVGSGDEVILAAYDYPGNFLCIHAVGATPVLVDVDADNWNMRPDALAAALSSKTRAVIASHLHGGMVPMKHVREFADANGLGIIEDAAQSPGAIMQGRTAGTWGDIGVLSFGGSKLLTAGRGGALLTLRAELHQRMRVLLHRGNHICPLSELQAAVLLPQLVKLDERNAYRAKAVSALTDYLKPVPGLGPLVNSVPCKPAYYKLGFQLDSKKFGLGRECLVQAMRAEGIALDEGFRALHVGRSPTRFRCCGALPESERAHNGTMMLHHPVLLRTEADVNEIVQAFRKVYANADRLRVAQESTRSVSDA
jgi:dTDP-4-amino-4,6-dideoxygalactose transaminase